MGHKSLMNIRHQRFETLLFVILTELIWIPDICNDKLTLFLFVCQDGEPKLITPCLCSGSLKFVHQDCLHRSEKFFLVKLSNHFPLDG